MIENERSQVWFYAAKVKGVFSYSETKREERGVGKHNGMTKTCAAGGDVTPHTRPLKLIEVPGLLSTES